MTVDLTEDQIIYLRRLLADEDRRLRHAALGDSWQARRDVARGALRRIGRIHSVLTEAIDLTLISEDPK